MAEFSVWEERLGSREEPWTVALESRPGWPRILQFSDLKTSADGKIGVQLAALARGEIGFRPHRLAGIDGADTRPVNLGTGQLSSYSGITSPQKIS